MKTVLTLAVLLLSLNSFAETFRVKDHLCGEIDPYLIGDACVFTLEVKGQELIVITDLVESTHDFYNVDLNALDLVEAEEAKEMKEMLGRSLKFKRNSTVYKYLHFEGLKPAQVEIKSTQISCSIEDASGDFLDATIHFDATLESHGDFHALKNLQFEYQLLDGDDVWSSGETDYQSLKNALSYRPRVYTGMDRFSFWYSDRRSYGEFDLILPAHDIMNGKKEFTSFVIMTAIDDHHGDTVAVDCKVLP